MCLHVLYLKVGTHHYLSNCGCKGQNKLFFRIVKSHRQAHTIHVLFNVLKLGPFINQMEKPFDIILYDHDICKK